MRSQSKMTRYGTRYVWNASFQMHVSGAIQTSDYRRCAVVTCIYGSDLHDCELGGGIRVHDAYHTASYDTIRTYNFCLWRPQST